MSNNLPSARKGLTREDVTQENSTFPVDLQQLLCTFLGVYQRHTDFQSLLKEWKALIWGILYI